MSNVAWWKLNETSGRTAADSVGNNNGSYQGDPTPVVGVVNNSLAFDGNGDYVKVTDNNVLDFGTGDFSISASVKTSDNNGIDVILDKRVEQSGAVQGYVLYTYNGRLGFQLADDSGYTKHNVDDVSVADGKWHDIAVIVDRDSSTGGKIYVDGEVVKQFNPTSRSGSLSNSADLTIGRRSDSNDEGYFTGSLDEIRLFDNALSAQEVRDINQPVDENLEPEIFIRGNDSSPVAIGNEGNFGVTQRNFNIVLSEPSNKQVEVAYTTNDGTATSADRDYTPKSGTLIFKPGETTKTISIDVIGDTKGEETEQFTLELSNPINATIDEGNVPGIGVIINDDGNIFSSGSIETSNSDPLFRGENNDIISGSNGNDTLIGDTEKNTLVGGQGNDELTGGSDADTFVFRANFGNDTITDFENIDIIDISSLEINSSHILGTDGIISQVGDDTVINFDDNNSITLANTEVDFITANNFLLS